MWQSWKHTWGCFSSIITSCLTRLPSGLHSIHCSGKMWNGHGGAAQQEALESKRLPQSTQVLIDYHLKKELILACNASLFRVGAWLLHWMADGLEKTSWICIAYPCPSRKGLFPARQGGAGCDVGGEEMSSLCIWSKIHHCYRSVSLMKPKPFLKWLPHECRDGL